MSFERVPVVSSNLREVAYDDVALMLVVSFHSGRRYQYAGVPRQVFEGLISAASAGRYFNAVVRHTYSCDRLE